MVKGWLGILFALFLSSYAGVAQAQEYQSLLDQLIGQGFYCSDQGTPVGKLYTAGLCPKLELKDLQQAQSAAQQGSATTIGSKVLVFFICNFENMLNEIFSKLYCAMQIHLIEPLSMVLILYVTLFGVVVTTGIVPLDGRAAFMHVMKLALVWGFATNADLAVGIGYTFFMKFASETIGIILTTLDPVGTSGQLDGSISATFTRLGSIVDNSLLGFLAEKGATTTSLMFVLVAVLFPIGIPLAHNVAQLVMMVGRAVVGYLLAITGITFLMTMSPIFLSFALFKQTSQLFDKWLQYLMSFSLQMLVVFAAVVLWVLVDQDYKKLYEEIKEVHCPYQVALEPKPTRMAFDLPSVCEYRIDATSEPQKITKASDRALSPMELLKRQDFISFMAIKILSLTLLAYMINGFMAMAPEIGKALAGQIYAARLGGTAPDTVTQPGVGIHLPGEKTMEAGAEKFQESFITSRKGILGKPIEAGYASWDTLINGLPGAKDASGKTTGKVQGLPEAFADDWLSLGMSPELMQTDITNNQNRYYFQRPIITQPKK